MSNSTTLTDLWDHLQVCHSDPYAKAKYKILLNWMGNIKDKSVLVVGCGSGEFCAYLTRAGAKVHGIDIEDRIINLAKSTAQRLSTDFHTSVSYIEDMDEDESYDFVIATDVIEHIENDKAALLKMHALLKEDGKLVLTVPALQFLMGHHDEILNHYRRYSKRTIGDSLQPWFKVSKMRYFGFSFIPVTFLLSRILRRPYPVVVVGNLSKSGTLLGRILNMVFKLETKVNFGLGTSLLTMADAKQLTKASEDLDYKVYKPRRQSNVPSPQPLSIN